MVTVAGTFKCTCGMVLMFSGENSVRCWWCEKTWECKEEELDSGEDCGAEINV